MSDIEIIKESEWRLQDDNTTELKRVIGKNNKGYCHGDILGFPESDYDWHEFGFNSIKEAETAMYKYLQQAEQDEEDYFNNPSNF